MPNVVKNCEICGKIFIIPKKRSGQRTCGNSCGRKLQWQREDYRKYQSELMTKRNQDPEHIEKRNKSALENITYFNQHRENYPEGVERHREAARLNMTKRNRYPEYAANRNKATSITLGEVSRRRSRGEFPNYQRILYDKMLETYGSRLKYNYHIPLHELKDVTARRYMADIAIPDLHLVIEVDGWMHDRDYAVNYDKTREFNLSRLGWKVLRVKNNDVYHNLSLVISRIENWIENNSELPKE